MIVLETKKIFDHLIELKFLKNERHRRPLKILVPVCATVLSIIVLLSMILDLVLGVDTRKNFYKVSITFGAISSFAAIILIYWHLIINRERYYTLLNDMQQILNDTSDESVAREMLYEKADRKIRHVLNVGVYVLMSIPIMYSSPFINVVIHVLLGIYTENSWIFFFLYWTPFPLNTPWRCASMATLQFLNQFLSYFLLRIISTLFVDCVVYTKSFMGEIKLMLNKLDRMATNRDSEAKMLEFGRDIINFHNRLYSCMHQLVYLLDRIFSILAPCIILGIICALFSLKKSLHEATTVDFLIFLFFNLGGLSIIFIFHFVGQELHSALSSLNEDLYATEWYRYPHKLRRLIWVMMMRTQQPFHFTAFGFIPMNMQTFVGVLKFIYSGFMLLCNSD